MAIHSRKKVTTIHEQFAEEQNILSDRRALRKKFLVRRLVVFFVLAMVVTGLIVYSLLTKVTVVEEKRAELELLETKMENLQDEQSVLEEQIQMLHNDEYLGQLARKYLYYSNDQEVIFALPNKEQEKSPPD